MGLQQCIQKLLPDGRTQVLAHSGAGYELAAIKSMQTVLRVEPEIIIMMAGICDITWRDRRSKETRLRYEKAADSVGHVMEAAKAAFEILDAIGKHKISFATTTGLCLVDYNYKPRKYMTEDEYDLYVNSVKVDHPQQQVLNNSVIEINRQLTEMNKKNGVPSTWTSTVIHSYYRKVHHHNYKGLGDGCHPDEYTKNKWARQIVKSIKRIEKGMKKDK